MPTKRICWVEINIYMRAYELNRFYEHTLHMNEVENLIILLFFRDYSSVIAKVSQTFTNVFFFF